MNESDKKDKDGVGDLFKKVVSTGLTAAFMTEDALREKFKDIPLPKEILNGLVSNAKNTKEEFLGAAKSELKSYLSKLNVSSEIDRVFEKYDFDIRATISLKKKEEK